MLEREGGILCLVWLGWEVGWLRDAERWNEVVIRYSYRKGGEKRKGEERRRPRGEKVVLAWC